MDKLRADTRRSARSSSVVRRCRVRMRPACLVLLGDSESQWFALFDAVATGAPGSDCRLLHLAYDAEVLDKLI